MWPLVRGFGAGLTAAETRTLYVELVEDPRWAAFGYDDGGLVGYAVIQDYGRHLRAGRRHQARLHDLYVHPDNRRTGVGRALMIAVTTWASTRVRHLEWQSPPRTLGPFYEALDHQSDPCPPADYPTSKSSSRPDFRRVHRRPARQREQRRRIRGPGLPRDRACRWCWW